MIGESPSIGNPFFEICQDMSAQPNGICSHYIKNGFCSLPSHFRCAEYVVRNEPKLSYSAIDTYSSCHRKFYWSQMIGLELIEKSWAMKLGSCASVILGWLHDERIPIDQAVQKYRDYIEDLIKQTMDPENPDLTYGHVDAWKMKAIFDAYIKLDLHTIRGITECQFRWSEPDFPKVHGYIDLVKLLTYDNHIGYEFKYTADADNYTKLTEGDQLITYFIGDPAIERMTLRCLVKPSLRQKQATKKAVGESMIDLYERMYQDILGRNIHHYFIDRSFWRSEFDLEAYKAKAKTIAKEIVSYLEGGGIERFYQNKKACFHPFTCDFVRVCENEIMEPWNMCDRYQKREMGRKESASLK